METTTRLLLPEVLEALKTAPQEVVGLTEEMHPADLADLVSALDGDPAKQLFEILPVESAARLLAWCEEEQRADLFEHLVRNALPTAIAISDEMAADDRADLYSELPSDVRDEILKSIDAEESRDIRQLLAYSEETAGALMTTEYVSLPAGATVSQAIELVRRDAANMETIYQAYAIDSHGTLLGAVSLRDLVTSPAESTVDSIMNPNLVTIEGDEDQEEAARLIGKYDLLALPVVDHTHRMLGIITVDDVLDVVEEEATEDVQRMGAVEPLESPYLDTPVFDLIRARAPWLLALFIAGLATESVLQYYSTAGIAGAAMLMWFVPLIISSGGNSGSQSATLIIRAMALGRIEARDGVRILRREVVVALSLGLMVACIGIARLMLTSDTRTLNFAAAISVSIVVVVFVGSMLGSIVPLILRRIGVDPAVSSTPFIASISDITGLLVYFEISRFFLG